MTGSGRSENKGNFEKVGEGLGGITGKAADTVVDWMGAAIRTVADSVGGWWSNRTPDEALRTFGEREDEACRRHFENLRNRSSNSYETVRPLYQFGNLAGQNPDYQGRTFDEVEGDLKTAWRGEHSQRYGDWSNVRDYINVGYTTRHSRGGNLP